MLDITLLGTSALLPLPDRALTAAALCCGGRSILFDCGEGTQTAARRAGVSLMKCDLIALTHYHGDHIFGLPGLLQTLGVMGREEVVTVIGPKGLKGAVGPLLRAAGDLPFPVALSEEKEWDLARLHPAWPPLAHLSAFPTRHRVTSRGYVFTLGRAGEFDPRAAAELGVPVNQWKLLQRGEAVEAGGRTILPRQVMGPARQGLKFVFSGDTAPCPSLIGAARDADLFICEATYGEDLYAEEANLYGHMTFSQAGRCAGEAGVKRLWLSHFSQRMEDPSLFLPAAQAFCPQAECGRDGMRLTLTFSK